MVFLLQVYEQNLFIWTVYSTINTCLTAVPITHLIVLTVPREEKAVCLFEKLIVTHLVRKFPVLWDPKIHHDGLLQRDQTKKLKLITQNSPSMS
jgi:hypothetical protein